MKNKPPRHKQFNTFKFQTFSERISAINVDIFHRVGHQYEDDSEDTVTFFQQSIEKWNLLNLTETFEALRKEMPMVQTLPQLLNKKAEVVEILLKNINAENTLAIQPTLELVVALARDLRQEFYPYYPAFLQRLIELLKANQPDQLEWTFTCLAYLFKFLWRCLVKDVAIVFDSLLPLLAHKKPHINNFAAESFAFVARKVKDKRGFLTVMLSMLESRPGGEVGCGVLLFEVIRGVKGQFHSCADAVLPLYLDALADEALPQEILFEVLTNTFEVMLGAIQQQKSGVLWTSLIKALAAFTAAWEAAPTERTGNNVLMIARLLLQAVSFKEARLLTDPVAVIRPLTSLLRLTGLPEPVLDAGSEIGAALLLSPHTTLPQEHANNLMVKLLAVPHAGTLMRFVVRVFDYSGFEALVLPQLTRHCGGRRRVAAETLTLFAQLVAHKTPPCETGADLAGWHRYPLDFPGDAVPTALLDALTDVDLRSPADVEKVACSLLLLPHVSPMDGAVAAAAVDDLLRRLFDGLNRSNTDAVVFLLSLAFESLVLLTDAKTLLSLRPLAGVVDCLAPLAADSVCCLRALDVFVTAAAAELSPAAAEAALSALYGRLGDDLSSPQHSVRLLTAHVFAALEAAEGGGAGVFAVCLAAEQVPNTITEYRDKLKLMQRLEFGLPGLPAGRFDKVPLQYLLGVLYVNFALLWEPTTLLIASHAAGMDRATFWPTFLRQLRGAAAAVTTPPPPPPAALPLGPAAAFLAAAAPVDRPDHVNYRVLLWKAMTHFADVAASRTRDLAPMFFEFLETEYFKADPGAAPVWNVKIYEKEDADKTTDMEVERSPEEAELDAMKRTLSQRPPRAEHRLGPGAGRTLTAHLAVFAKMKDPKSAFREADLRRLYYDFLSSKSADVQKLALDCLMAYKFKFMTPYRENLYGLVDDRSFKAQLTLFRVDKESEVIAASHREELMPVILRIAFSKMMAKTPASRGGGGMAAGLMRRSVVLRFLAGCHEHELVTFVEMAFRIYTSSLQDDMLAMVEGIMQDIDLEKVFPPRRLQSSMTLLNVILHQFGGLMGHRMLSYLLRVLLCISANVAGMFMRRDMMHVGYVPMLRGVRAQCLETAAKFFDRFTKFEWTANGLDAVFRALVLPGLGKLETEGVKSPTALLKLLIVWSQHPRYFPLLGKHAPGDPGLSPLPHIMRLLGNDRVHPSVATAILELTERLLTLSDFDATANADEQDEGPPAAALPVTDCLPIDTVAVARLALPEQINLGSALLLPHIPPILARLQRKLVLRNKTLNRRELVILSRVSELVWESDTSDTLLKLLLPMLMKKSSAGEDVVVPLIATLTNLVKNLDEPEKYVRNLAPLFGQVSGAGPRRMLSTLLETIAERCGSGAGGLADSLALVAELNACDRKWIDQPDYTRRLDGFKRVNAMVDAGSVDFQLGLIVIHTCFHYLKVETDLSLRDSASHCLRRLAPALCRQYDADKPLKEVLLNNTVLNLVRQGLQSKTETLHEEVLGLLGAMARECPAAHPVLADLAHYTSADDPEVDFFENLAHLQGHRKARALGKFATVARTLTRPPNPRTLAQFVLPMAARFLTNEKYAGKHVTVDAAVDAVGTVCRLLPWHHYDLVLRFYLDKLKTLIEFQKQLVRVVIAILDAFHFDLSRAGEVKKAVRDVEMVALEFTATPQPEEAAPPDETKLEETPMDESQTEDGPLEESTVDDGPLEESTVDPQAQLMSELDSALEAEEGAEEAAAAEAEGPAAERQAVLTPAMALRARNAITRELLPQLHACIAQRSNADMKHKVNRRQGGEDRDEEDILRVPIALAAVKLLQQLPREILERNLPGIFMKLCSFLKSRLESVRRVTRQTLGKVMLSLGPDYLSYLVNEMCGLLTRGFQVHVLVYTIHSVVVALKDLFRPGDADACLKDVLECCKADLFGLTAEEKKVAGIVSKVQEARSTKSYDTYKVMAQFITEKCLTDLLLPVQQVLVRSNSARTVQRCSEILRNVVVGLSHNKFIAVDSLLIFMFGTVSQSIPELATPAAQPVSAVEREKLARSRPDTFLIPRAPRTRYGTLNAQARTTACTNAHVLVEFGLKLFHVLLKREKVRSDEYRPLIDPVVPVVVGCIDAKHIKLTTLALFCMRGLLKMELPAVKDGIEKVVELLFALLHKFAAAGLSKGDNFDLVAAVFKAIVVLVRDVRWHTITPDQLKALLLYAEQDMHDSSRQATAFALLRAILSRKLVVPEIHDVMARVANMSITSESNGVRHQARQVFHQFLMDYPLGSRLDLHLGFYIAQLNYELQSGRESTLEMLHTLIVTFPDETLSKQCGLLFVSIGAQLVNDEVPKCRKMAARCLQAMLERLTNNDRDKLFDIAALWLTDKRVHHRKLAAQLCGLFVLVEGVAFERRLAALLPDVIAQFGRGYDDGRPGKMVRVAHAPVAPEPGQADRDTDHDVDAAESLERMSDHHVFQVLQLLLKLAEHCPRFFVGRDFQEYVSVIAENAQSLLAHPHEWVRLASSQFLGHAFAALDPAAVAAAAHSTPGADRRGFLAAATAAKVKTLVLDLAAQLNTEVAPLLAAQVVKNLVFLGRVLKSMPARPVKRPAKPAKPADPEASDNDDDETDDGTDISLLWMIRRMRKLVNTEVVQSPRCTVMRTAVFQWIGAMILDLTKPQIVPLLYHLLAPVAREITSEDDSNPEMHRLAIDVSKMMKSKLGMEEYTRQLAVLEQRIACRRADRKRVRTREAVTQPELFAKRKIEKQLKKKDNKRRKIDMLKGRKTSAKKRVRKEAK